MNTVHDERDTRIRDAAPALYAALKECSFALAKLVAAVGAFTDENAKALDAATAALKKAEGK